VGAEALAKSAFKESSKEWEEDEAKNQQGADSVDDLTGSKCQRNIFCVRRKHV